MTDKTDAVEKSTVADEPIPLWKVLLEELNCFDGAYWKRYEEELKPPLKTPDLAAGSAAAQAIENEAILPRLYGLIHERNEAGTAAVPNFALCLSGGGIRSATFALGALQALAKRKLLGRFQYLSTVSGGGYIGSWITTWANHSSHAEVIAALADEGHEDEPIRHLREYSNYLSPKLGLFAADTWTLAAIVLRNLLLNWAVLLPLIAVPLLVPRFAVRSVLWMAQDNGTATTTFFVIGGILQVIAVSYLDRNRPSIRACRGVNWRWEGRQIWFLWLCLTPLLLGSSFLVLAWCGYRLNPCNLSKVSSWACFGTANSPRWWKGERWALVWSQIFVNLLAWLINLPLNARRILQNRRSIGEIFAELTFIIAAACLGGWLLYEIKDLAILDPIHHAFLYAAFGEFAYLMVFLLAGAVLHALFSAAAKNDNDLEWTARAAGWVLIVGFTWLVVALLVIFGPSVLSSASIALRSGTLSLGGIAGLLAALIGSSSLTPASRDTAVRSGGTLARPIVRKILVPLCTGIFILSLIVMLAYATGWVILQADFFPDDRAITQWDTHANILREIHAWRNDFVPHWKSLAGLVLIFSGVSGLAGLAVNINKFSLHGAYRNRLIRAYLGASRTGRESSASFSPFSGFDPADDLLMKDIRIGPQQPLFHVVNMALNLVSGGNLAWQQRKAESFTATKLHCGSARLGYRDSAAYGGSKPSNPVGIQKPISLGTAMAISGAAANPNMGYHSSPAVTFIMTLFNVRMGYWLGNPARARKCTAPQLRK